MSRSASAAWRPSPTFRLDVRAGTVTGLIGPNGAGKTTLFNVVSGLQRPDRGHVRIAGRDVTGLGPHRRARLGLARTFQRLELFSHLSSEDNVLVGLEAGRRSTWSPRPGRRRGCPPPRPPRCSTGSGWRRPPATR